MSAAAAIREPNLEATGTWHGFVLDEMDSHGAIKARRRRESNYKSLGPRTESEAQPVGMWINLSREGEQPEREVTHLDYPTGTEASARSHCRNQVK